MEMGGGVTPKFRARTKGCRIEGGKYCKPQEQFRFCSQRLKKGKKIMQQELCLRGMDMDGGLWHLQ